jgi:hypothetical protein
MQSLIFRNAAAAFIVASLAFPVGSSIAHTIEVPDDKKDEITDEIENGLLQYLDGGFAEAKFALENALQMLAKLKAQGLSAFLPAIPDDSWTREDSAQTAAMPFGGGTSASAKYTSAGQTCNVSITTDSPMLQMLAMAYNSPAMLAAQGGRFESVNGQRVVVTNKGEAHVIINNYFIQYTGNNCTEENKMALAGATDFEGIKTFQ